MLRSTDQPMCKAPRAAPRLAIAYASYFSVFGLLLPYWSLFLAALNTSARNIGLIAAVSTGTKIIGPNIFGSISDRIRAPSTVFQIGTLLALISSIPLLWRTSLPVVLLSAVAFSFFFNALPQQLEVVTLQTLGKDSTEYGYIRMWGSLGFIASVLGWGFLLKEERVELLPFCLSLSFLLLFATAVLLPGHQSTSSNDHRIKYKLSISKTIVLFLSLCFLHQACHAPYYVFYSILIETHHSTNGLIGPLWTVAIVSEILMFLVTPYFLRIVSPEIVLLSSLIISGFRWLIIGLFYENVPILFMAQILHAFSFSSFHAAAIELVRRMFRRGTEGRGQALYASAGFGLGTASGSYLAGIAWENYGEKTFAIAGLGEAVAVLICIAFLSLARPADSIE